MLLHNNKLSPALQKILLITNVTHYGSLESVVNATQKAWLRKPGIERWHMGDTYQKFDQQLAPLFKELGMQNEIKPSQEKYDYVLILGDTVNCLRTRFAYALDQWQKGIRFSTLVFLVGERPLLDDPAHHEDNETEAELYDRTNMYLPIRADWQEPSTMPQTETEMARMVYDQAIVPDEFKKLVTVRFIDTPMQLTTSGQMRRPNTADTIKLWLKKVPHRGSILAISNQPYIGYQHAVLQSYIPPEMSVETVGPKAYMPLSADLLLDTLARWLYQEDFFYKTHKGKKTTY